MQDVYNMQQQISIYNMYVTSFSRWVIGDVVVLLSIVTVSLLYYQYDLLWLLSLQVFPSDLINCCYVCVFKSLMGYSILFWHGRVMLWLFCCQSLLSHFCIINMTYSGFYVCKSSLQIWLIAVMFVFLRVWWGIIYCFDMGEWCCGCLCCQSLLPHFCNINMTYSGF